MPRASNNASPGSGSGSGSGSGGYTTTSSGTNQAGNHYCSRDFGPGASNSNSYHYSNTDGSYYYSNPNVSALARLEASAERCVQGSTYYNSGDGYSKYSPNK
ncbi:uncharacterized protein EKO05_0002413 [Ascochyta rabiei]|uniref:Uncharacterized protein n=1 Tax=Didymella rabiei TaxID=5454 RepID=A0A162VNL7_DIDRA|nr:uncharacterized protein EKO05_0002413 [Ascochyta rabiei]KZM18550.1 hypothetical protein ST47_g10255 [Ascochyta rabiei]UPX11826.1 hypothetical protein EKO05_0002413 [Ascochyta rabiei]